MTKREREVAQYKYRVNFASSLPVFTGGLGTRNGSGCRIHSGRQLHHSLAAPQEGRQRRKIPMPRGQSHQEMRRWRGIGSQVPSVKQGGTLTAQFCLNSARGLNAPGSLCPEAHENPRAQQSPEGQIAQEVMARKQHFLKCFRGVTNRALHYSNQDISEEGATPHGSHTCTHTPPKAGAYKMPRKLTVLVNTAFRTDLEFSLE